MELSNDFSVDVPIDEAWRVLTDLERIAPCMPGATLEAVDGEQYKGAVKVKVGPVTAQYRGIATFVERDEGSHRAVVRAEGRETRGQGNASATITASLEASGSSTRVSVVTELAVTGRVAQFGRGVMADVSNKLLGQFVGSLESTVLSGSASSAASAAPDGPGAVAASAASDQPPVAAGQVAAEVVPIKVLPLVAASLGRRILAMFARLGALFRRGNRSRPTGRGDRPTSPNTAAD